MLRKTLDFKATNPLLYVNGTNVLGHITRKCNTKQKWLLKEGSGNFFSWRTSQRALIFLKAMSKYDADSSSWQSERKHFSV